MLLQTGLAAPLVLALIVYTARQQDRSGVQRSLSLLLSMILVWMIGMLVAPREVLPTVVVAALLIPPAVFMSPLFLLIMLQYARVESFGPGRGGRWALLAPFCFFLGAFVTNDLHGQMLDPEAFSSETALEQAGPLFWAYQLWSNAVAVLGLAICLSTAWHTPSPSERRRMLLLCFGALFPLVAHIAHMANALPTAYPLTPAALAITSLCVVAAISRYKLLDVQPIARRDVLEASSDGVIVADVDGFVVDLNPAAAELLGASRSECCGRPIDEVVKRLGRTEPEGGMAGILSALREGRASSHVELETEADRILELNVGVASDPGGATAGSFVVLRDRSGERRAERLLHQRQKLESVGILAAGIAHEVNNPLAYVRSNIEHLRHAAELIEDQLDSLPKELADELRELPEIIDDSIGGLDRIQGIVQGLVRFARMPTRRRVDCDANAAVLEAARFASLDRGATVPLETDLEAGLPQIAASPNQLVQVVLNLFLNARIAVKGQENPLIVASTRVLDGAVEIRIVDNGPGVPESIREQIFDPFFTTGGPGEGTGLGLAIAFDIVRDHEGSLELESPAGGGACFCIRLPLPPASD